MPPVLPPMSSSSEPVRVQEQVAVYSPLWLLCKSGTRNLLPALSGNQRREKTQLINEVHNTHTIVEEEIVNDVRR